MRVTRLSALAVAAGLTVSLAACGTDSVSSSGGDKGVDSLDIVVPADAGGGWDQTGRAMAKVIEEDELVKNVAVTNQPGAGGTTGLASLKNAKSKNTLMVTGYVMVGAVELNKAAVSLSDVTPIARLTEEQEVIVVPAKSKYQTMDDLLADVKANGRKVTVAGGSQGGVDHILAGMVWKAAGIDSKDLNYIPYDGGGETVAALLGNDVSVGISGAGEYREQIAAGELRALAISGSEPVEGYDGVKPLTEQGIDVTLTNWRGVVAPPNLSDSEEKNLAGVVDELHGTEAWKKVLDDNDWTDAYMKADEFEPFVGEQTTAVKTILKEVGLVE